MYIPSSSSLCKIVTVHVVSSYLLLHVLSSHNLSVKAVLTSHKQQGINPLCNTGVSYQNILFGNLSEFDKTELLVR